MIDIRQLLHPARDKSEKIKPALWQHPVREITALQQLIDP